METNLKAALSTLELTVGFIEQLRMGYLYENSKLLLAEKEYETYMSIIKIAYELLNITGDKDLLQLVTDRIIVSLPGKSISDSTDYTPDKVFEKIITVYENPDEPYTTEDRSIRFKLQQRGFNLKAILAE